MTTKWTNKVVAVFAIGFMLGLGAAQAVALTVDDDFEAASFDPVEPFQRIAQLFHELRIQRSLALAQSTESSNFRLVRQIGDDPFVGLHASQDVGLNQAAQRCIPVVLLAGVQTLHELLERIKKFWYSQIDWWK